MRNIHVIAAYIIGVLVLASVIICLSMSTSSAPLAVADFFGILADGDVVGLLIRDALYTLRRAVTALLGSLPFVIVGVLLGLYPSMERIFSGPLDFLRSLPAITLYPFVLVVVGSGERGIFMLTVVTTSLLLIIHSAEGVASGSDVRRSAIFLMGGGRLDVLRYVVFPEMLPHVLGGLRIAWSVSLVLVTIGEILFAVSRGLGAGILAYTTVLNWPFMFWEILILGIMGSLGSLCIKRLEVRLGHWRSK